MLLFALVEVLLACLCAAGAPADQVSEESFQMFNLATGPDLATTRHLLSDDDISLALDKAFEDNSRGRSDTSSRLEMYKAKITDKLATDLTTKNYVSAHILARAISLDIDLSVVARLKPSTSNVSIIPVRGGQTSCQQSPPCIDLACGRCFDPLTSLHADCGPLSFFKCTGLLAPACLPWTCTQSASPSAPLLRNYLPRRVSGCPGGSGNSKLAFVSPGNVQVEMTGLGVVTNALTKCAEFPICFDGLCELCYDTLEMVHAPCPEHVTVRSCAWLPDWCQPLQCWTNKGKGGIVLLRDQEPKKIGGVC